MPLPDKDLRVNVHDLRVPRQAAVARVDLIRAVVVERLENNGTDRCSVGDVLLRIGAFCHEGQFYVR